MNTPIYDFLKTYEAEGKARFHMPGHKGQEFLGCEALDITEVAGADSLYEASGIIAESEANAAALFGAQRTCYSTEGSSQCVRAMLYLALTNRPEGSAPVIVAARNVHKSFVSAAALLDFEIVWLWPEKSTSLCSCVVTAEQLEQTLSALAAPPAAVYVTSPDYLGAMADIAALAEVAHRYGTVLVVDNAHGAYLHFLKPDGQMLLKDVSHPLDQGADLCCDSAHKTLPVLTGGAYLHVGKAAPAAFTENAKQAMALFGSTSPSYLTLASLDLCNRYLADDYEAKISGAAYRVDSIRRQLGFTGWQCVDSDPMRLTVCAPVGTSGTELADRLRAFGVECEYADAEHVVLMATPENTPTDLFRILPALGQCPVSEEQRPELPIARGEQVMTVRQAMFAPHETVPAAEALGRICGAPTVSCPPAIPVVVSGERIGPEAIELFAHYGVETVDVLK